MLMSLYGEFANRLKADEMREMSGIQWVSPGSAQIRALYALRSGQSTFGWIYALSLLLR